MTDYRTFLTGLVAAPHSPMRPDQSLNLEMVELQARHLATSGVSGAFICGTTGECSSLRLEERKRLAEFWAPSSRRHGLRLIVHVGGNCLAEARELAVHAADVGADAISALAPSYLRPASMSDLVDCMAEIAGAAPELPFYYYDIPGFTGVRLPPKEFLLLGAPRIPNLAGLKFTNPDLLQLQACVRLHDGAYNILFGCDEALLAGLALGAQGAVGSTYNYAAPLYLRMIAAFESGDLIEARRVQHQAVEMVEALFQYNPIAAGKTAMRFLGLDCGPVRPPLPNLTIEEAATFKDTLTRLDVLAIAAPA